MGVHKALSHASGDVEGGTNEAKQSKLVLCKAVGCVQAL